MAPIKATLLVLSGIALFAPFVLVARAQARLADSVASVTVGALLRVAGPLGSARAAAVASEPAEVVFDAPIAAPAPSAKKAGGKRPSGAALAKPQGLFVSADSVLRLSKSAARPRGSFVAQTPEHPAGLRLVGVGALGIGVQDGDILVDALGVTPRSSGQIVGAIIEARARRVRFLSGTLWRGGHTFQITVEQPYIEPA